MKKLVLVGCGLGLVVAAVVYFGLSNLGPIIKNAVNTYGPGITKTEVNLGDAGVSLLSGEVELKDFLVGNPQGFESPQAIKVGSIYVDVDEKSLTGNPVVIDKIEILSPEITYEKTARDDNFNALLRNLKGQSGKARSDDGAKKTAGSNNPPAGGGKKLLIRQLLIKDGRIDLTAAALGGRTVTTELPYIEIQNLGGKENGIRPAKAMNLILAALYAQIQSPDVTAELSKGLESLGVSAKDVSVKGLGDKSSSALESVKGAVENMLGD